MRLLRCLIASEQDEAAHEHDEGAERELDPRPVPDEEPAEPPQQCSPTGQRDRVLEDDGPSPRAR